MLDDLTNSDLFKGLVSIVTGGAFVGWYREHRRGRKDAQGFALEFMKTQSERIDALVSQVAKLEADHRVATEALDLARQTIHDLKNELFKANASIMEKDNEITRLKTALGEHERHSA